MISFYLRICAITPKQIASLSEWASKLFFFFISSWSKNDTFFTHISRVIYIICMQSSLPTTIYVQNLSFLVTQISTSHKLFSIWPIYMIFMGDTDKVCNFLTPTKKRVKKGWNLKFCKKVKILKQPLFF